MAGHDVYHGSETDRQHSRGVKANLYAILYESEMNMHKSVKTTRLKVVYNSDN
jgi:hypothetical protein